MVRALAVYNGELYAAGAFTLTGTAETSYIARWTGAAWEDVGGGLSNPDTSRFLFAAGAHAMAVHNGELVVGGNFNTAGSIDAPYVARWNGAEWQPMGTLAPDHSRSEVRAFLVHNGNLIAGGMILTATGNNSVVRWNGAAWEPFIAGIISGVPAVRALGTDGPSLFAGLDNGLGGIGNAVFRATTNAGGAYAWQAASLSYSGSAYAFGNSGGQAFLGGVGQPLTTGEGRGVARWDGAAWHGLSTGGFPATFDGTFAMADYQTDLIVGSSAYTGAKLNGWDGTQMYALSDGLAQCRNMAATSQGLIASGSIGSQKATGIFRYDGQAWHTIASLPFNAFQKTFNNVAEVPGGGLAFTLSQGFSATDTRNIALWNGAAFSPLGERLAGASDIEYFNEHIIVSGSFTSTPSGTALPYIAQWSGAQWEPFTPGLPGPVASTHVLNGQLYASYQTGTNQYAVARWSASGWDVTGTFDTAPSLSQFEGNLLATGGFTLVNGTTFVNRVALLEGDAWRPLGGGLPEVTFGGALQFTAELDGRLFVAMSAVWDGHTWRTLNGSVTNASAAWNGDLYGSRAAASLNAPFGSLDAATFLKYSQSCGPACGSADFNNDGDTGTDQDIEAFFACIGGTCCPTCGHADFNGDGDTGTDQDIEAFFRVLGGGNC